MIGRPLTHRLLAPAIVFALTTTPLVRPAWAQTPITPPPNKYAPAEDVKLGLQAADEARKQLPLLTDANTREYLAGIGNRLVAVIPTELRHAEFRYSFEVVNQKEINAFALPGGPMFVNRGMMEAAQTEGEVAGVMAHELSHVILRHGTAQQAKATKFQIGAIAGQILGAVVGGTAGSIIAQGSNLGISTYFMKFSREYEKQADLMGAQLLARAGYDAREMANMFKTIEKEGGGGGPEWMSDHPNPGNRFEYITQEAKALKVTGPPVSNGEFQKTQARLKGMPPAYTAQQIAQMQKSGSGAQPAANTPAAGAGVVRVAAPALSYKTYAATNLRISVPSNWQYLARGKTLMFAPDGAYFKNTSGSASFTHGVEVGVVTSPTRNLQSDSEALIKSFDGTNPQLRWSGAFQRTMVGGRAGLTTSLTNVSEVTKQPEYISVSTTQSDDMNMLYVIGVAPQTESGVYAETFSRIRQNLQIK